MKEEIVSLPLEKLLLDEENPRLAPSVERSQQQMIDYIAESTSIEELMSAIAENGYFPGEPLVVIPHDKQNGCYIVVEGNRRLTALKLLRDAGYASRPGLRIKELSEQLVEKPKSVPVVVCANRAEVLPYLGYRHITGVKQWEPLAKARYIEQLYGISGGKTPRDRYTEVARAIGSRRDHIKRNLDALAFYKVVADKDFYGIPGLDDQSIKFAVLSTALADERIASFVGVSKEVDGEHMPLDPIDDQKSLKRDEVRELTEWLFKKDELGKTRVGESRNLRMLGAVVANGRALSAFRSNSPLKIAYQFTSSVTADFLELLYTAEGTLTEAAGMVATVQHSNDGEETARRIMDKIRLIGRAIVDKKKANDDGF